LPKGDQQSRILSEPANTVTPRSRSALSGGTGTEGGHEVMIATSACVFRSIVNTDSVLS